MESCLAGLPLAAERNLAYAFLVAAILVITLTLLLRLYRYQKRRTPGVSIRPSQHYVEPDSRGLRAGAPESIVRWEVEMHDLARDLKAEVESKMSALGHLIHDADRAAERLERALAAAPPADADCGDSQGPPAEPRDGQDTVLRSEVYTLSDYGFSAADIASRLSTPVGEVELILQLREEGK